MDTPFRALDLKEPTTVEALTEDGATIQSPPRSSIIRYDFPARGDRGPVKVVWYDGGAFPPPNLVRDPKLLRDKDYSIIFIGEKGTILAGLNIPPMILQENLRKSFTPPPPPPPPNVNHWQQWVNACLGGQPASANFDYGGPLTEIVLLGNLALRAGQRIQWDSKIMHVTNLPAAQQYVKRHYRNGWEL